MCEWIDTGSRKAHLMDCELRCNLMQVDPADPPMRLDFLSDALPFKLLGAATDETRLGEQVQKLISNNPRGQANARQRE